MSEVRLDDKISEKSNEVTVISGYARSGTTIMGKLLHSFQDVEYTFEPPMMASLFSLIDTLDENNWKLLYETYIYEEFLMNALAGRGINCNTADDSSIYKVKSESIINQRLSASLRKKDAEKVAEKSKVAFKLPDIIPFLPRLKEYYPNTRIIVMLREAPDVIYSLLEKQWFADQSLRQENLIWPNRFIDGYRIPYWVDSKDCKRWLEMNELDRIAYYYIRMNQPMSELPDCIRITYSELMENPHEIIRKLAGRLNAHWSDKTEEILSTVKRRRKDVDKSILDKISPDLQEDVRRCSEDASI